LAIDQFGKQVPIQLHIIRVCELHKWQVAELLSAVAEHLLERAITLKWVSRGIHERHADSRLVKQCVELPLALPQLLFGSLARSNFFPQLFVDGCKLSGPFKDALLEALIQSLDFFFGLLEPWRFDHLPIPVSLCDGKLVCTRHVQNFSRSARGERVGAQHGQALIGDRRVERLFVFAKVFPVFLFEPGCISGHSHAGIASGQCAGEFLIPTAGHSLEIKRATLEIPVAGQDNFYAALSQVSIKVRNSLFQCMPGFFLCQRLGNHPQAGLLAFQSGFEIGEQRVEEILFRLVEVTKVCTPGHIAHDADSGLPHLGCHRGYLPIFSLGSSLDLPPIL
jgi:hypothetical protein